MVMSHTGQCLCGEIRLAATGDPSWVSYCHCASCRRHTGSPVTCFVNFATNKVAFESAPAVYRSSAGVRRSFCGRCGTPIAYETDKRPGEIDLYLNVFDDPATFRPESHAFYAERISWFDTRDELPRK